MNCPICKCGGTLSNLGHRCTTQFDEAVMVVFVPTFDSTGAQNGILKTQDLNKAYFDSMVNHTDPTKRWYPSPKLKEVANKRADPQYWEFSDQSKQFLFEGSRNFTALITAESGSGATAPGMKKQIESARCSDGISVFILSVTRQILGNNSDDNLSIVPIQIDEQSVYAGFMFSSQVDTQAQHLALSFNFSTTERDENLVWINCSELDGYDILLMKALLDICYELVDMTQTSLTIKLVTKEIFGSAINPYTADGLVAADFVSSDSAATSKIYNATDDADVTITSVTEQPDGTYLLAFTSQTLGDALVPYAVKTGYDFTCMKENPIEVSSS